MKTNLYEEFYPLVLEMLDEFGADGTLISTGPTAPILDAKRAGRAPTVATPLSRPVRVTVGPISIQGVNGRKETRTVATTLVQPREGDKLTVGETTWTIAHVTRIDPQGKAIVFVSEVI